MCKKVLISLCVIMFIVLMGLLFKDITVPTSTAKTEHRLVTLDYDLGWYEIVYDNQTNVEYILTTKGGVSVLVDKEGNPLLYKEK